MATKLIIFAAFLVSFAAGLTVGLRSPRGAQPNAVSPASISSPTTMPARQNRDSWLAAQLNLTGDQQEQLKKIWSETAAARRGTNARDGAQQEDPRRKLRRERDEAIAALVRTEDRAAYDRILANYTQQTEALEQQWRASYDNAVERTKQVLNEEQRTKYESILKSNQWSGGSPASRDRRPGADRGGDRSPSTQPASRPSN